MAPWNGPKKTVRESRRSAVARCIHSEHALWHGYARTSNVNNVLKERNNSLADTIRYEIFILRSEADIVSSINRSVR